MATADAKPSTPTARGLSPPCIRCGEEGTIRLDLSDLKACTFSCSTCDNEFTKADVLSLIAEWTKCLNWIEAVPLG